jgi:hypothetical protein
VVQISIYSWNFVRHSGFPACAITKIAEILITHQERRRLEESYERSGALAEEVAAATGALSEREEELAEVKSQLRASKR